MFLLLACFEASGQRFHVYSEFTRFGADGEVLPQDRGSPPRDILSPPMSRNAHSSFRIVIRFDKLEKFTLDAGQNPENSVRISMYREAGGAFEAVNLPHESQGQGTLTFFMDIWVPRETPPDRIKVEPQLYVASLDEWYTYPMEARVMQAIAPSVRYSNGKLPLASAPADHSAHAPLRAELCGVREAAAARGEPVSAALLIRRNALEHLALAAVSQKRARKDLVREAFLKASGESSTDRWCAAPFTPGSGPEWYLRFRDAIFQASPGEP